MLGRLVRGLWQRTRARRVASLLAEGRRLVGEGRPAEARARFERVLELAPDNADGDYWLGALHGMLGDRQAAAAHLSRAIAARPDLAIAHADLGNVKLLDGDAAAAIQCYRTALAHDPQLVSAYGNLARALRTTGRNAEALSCLMEAESRAPLEDDRFVELVRLMLELGRSGEAQALAERRVQAAGSASAHKAAGLVALNRHDPEAALACFGRARELAPPDPDLWLNIGIARQELLRLDDALAAYAQALAIDAGFAPARWRAALVRLMQGDFEGGWTDYEARHASADRPCREFPYQPWEGESLHGKTILVHAEQGLGDEIMFASCLREVMDRAALCIVECHPMLARIFQRSFPSARVHGGAQIAGPQTWLAGYPIPDYQIPAGSLPRLLRRTRGAFPAHQGYLLADPGRVGLWKDRLAALGPGLKVGISWRGGTAMSRAALRSLELEALLPVLRTPRVRFVNLQYTRADGEIAALAGQHGVHIENWPEAIMDYDETAALVCALDLVISVCTAVVHLAGALGRPVWVMAPYSPEWRYGHAGTAMPWYPSAHIYRQPGFRQWGPVIERIAWDLQERTQRAGASGDHVRV